MMSVAVFYARVRGLSGCVSTWYGLTASIMTITTPHDLGSIVLCLATGKRGARLCGLSATVTSATISTSCLSCACLLFALITVAISGTGVELQSTMLRSGEKMSLTNPSMKEASSTMGTDSFFTSPNTSRVWASPVLT